jgi:Gas vesicle synthesis protein GvpL/GvpF
MSAVAEATALYVYGVVESSAPVGARVVEEGALAAVVAEVPLSEFGDGVLEERLNDRAWLEAHVRQHQDVLEGVSATATVVPFRFGTIYNDVDALRAMLRAREDELMAALERVRGRTEVGVKAWAGEDRVEEAAAPSSGRAYLEQRLGAQERARTATARLADAAREAHERLVAHAEDAVANRPQPRELTGRDDTMILNGAYLVADVEPIRREVEELTRAYGADGITFELTGPWPPYNFVGEAERE